MELAALVLGSDHRRALVHPENKEMLGMLRGLQFPERVRWEDGVEHVNISIQHEAA